MKMYSPEMRERVSKEAKGKTIATMEWCDSDGGYWAIEFTDGSEMCVRLMAEIAGVWAEGKGLDNK
jgi:hypothetical protein